MNDKLQSKLDKIKNIFLESIMVKQKIIEKDMNTLSKISSQITKSIKEGGKIMLCSNGGSAADAQHLAAEMLVRLRPKNNREGVPAISLAQEVSTITACGNDFGYDILFERNVKPVSYSVVKTGLIGLTRYISTYWPEKNVRCNALCPGGIENGQEVTFVKNISSRIPLGRMAKSNEYQGTLVWMLSDSSSYLNGAIIPVDGGRTAI